MPRSQLDVLDETMDAIGFDRVAFLHDQRAEVAASLARGSDARTLDAIAARAADVAAEVLAHHLAVIPPDPPIACASGCAHCCHLRADITVVEAARLALHLRATRSAEALAAVRIRIDERARHVGQLDANQRAAARVACALLEGGKCIAYEARPLVCRGCNSARAEDCERSLDDASVDTVVYAPQRALYRYAGQAIAGALGAAGLDGRHHELHTALAAALASEPQP